MTEYQIALRKAFKLGPGVSERTLAKLMLTEGRMFKLCDGTGSCETWLHVNKFPRDANSEDGFNRLCKVCFGPGPNRRGLARKANIEKHEAQGRAIAAGALERKEAREALARQNDRSRELAEKMGYWEEDPL